MVVALLFVGSLASWFLDGDTSGGGGVGDGQPIRHPLRSSNSRETISTYLT